MRKETKERANFAPILYHGQYLDTETELVYNRFRYYAPSTGAYISQDPIGLAGNNPTLYAFVENVNTEMDVLGLDENDIATKLVLVRAGISASTIYGLF
ncbi:RHS repeat-associated core domain-containing protein [Treponema denticola]|uniref:RHS repeat-associated core domain-containing protein n=1 Tax=Treponema denticola TaxID=158 RepID=UPI0009B7878F